MPVPIVRGEKMPIGKDWQTKLYSHPDIEHVFSHECSIGVMLGEPSNGLVDIDLDCPEAIELAPLYLPPTPAITGRANNKGSHWWYIAPGLDTRRHQDKFTRSAIVELRSTGAQTLIGPSIHPDGDIYDTLDAEPAEVSGPMLAACVQALADAVMVKRHGENWDAQQPERAQQRIEPREHDQARVIERAIKYVNAMPPAVSGAGGHNAAFAAACTLTHGFELGYDDALYILEEHYNHRCDPPWSRRELMHKVDQSLKMSNHSKPRGHLVHAMREPETHGVDLSGILEPKAPTPKKSEPVEFPPHLLRVPGLIGDVIDYNLSTATRPQPVLALGAAIALQSVLAARKVRDELGNRTNLYIVGVAKSAGGKEHARQINKQILYESNQTEIEGNEDIASDAGLFAAVEANPAVLFQLDEFGRFLRTIGDAKKNPHMYNVITLLMRLFSSAQGAYKGKAYADTTRNKIIHQPCVTVYGTTVPGHFYESLTRESMGDGFVARMLVFESEGTPGRVRRPQRAMPESIIERASYWREYRPHGGNLGGVHPDPTLVESTDEAVAIFEAFGESFDYDKVQRGSEIEASIWGRALEKAYRLALIAACSRDPEGLTITAEDANWAVELSQFLTERMMHRASQYVSESQFDERQKRVLRIIADAGGVMTKWALGQKTRWLKKRDREELLENMIETNQIEVVITETGKRPRTEYQLV
jgi:hypothetical protein